MLAASQGVESPAVNVSLRSMMKAFANLLGNKVEGVRQTIPTLHMCMHVAGITWNGHQLSIVRAAPQFLLVL